MQRVKLVNTMTSLKLLIFFLLITSHMTKGTEHKRISIVSVTAVEGQRTELPCDVTHPKDDSVFLILWFKVNLTTPICSYDLRPGVGDISAQWIDETQFGNRAALQLSDKMVRLMIDPVMESDVGLYRCRVDFSKQPTKTTRVGLSVIVLPTSVTVEMEGRPVTSVIGPFREGDTTTLTCKAVGGFPTPSVHWYMNGRVIDEQLVDYLEEPQSSTVNGEAAFSYDHSKRAHSRTRHHLQRPREESRGAVISNIITLGPLTRQDLKKLVICEAENTNLTAPVAAHVMVDMNLEPLTIQLQPPDRTLSVGRPHDFICDVRGSRPPPTITWWQGTQRKQGAKETTTSDGNVTISTLTLKLFPHDDGTKITCRAENPSTNTLLEENLALVVHYIPEAVVRLGSSLDAENIKEGDDVYFECLIHSNPKAYKITWQHNGQILAPDHHKGIIISNQSLAIQKVKRHHAGRYNCIASNIEGDGNSNSILLDIRYSPVCNSDQQTTYGVARNEDAEVTCRVSANPPATHFHWAFNNTADTIEVPSKLYTTKPMYSIITYTPVTELDYGTLLCWARNSIGQQTLPCLFRIVPAGKPDPPSNCTVSNQTESGFDVECESGFDGGIIQTFHMNINSAVILNNTRPLFKARNLKPDTHYKIHIWSFNEKGASSIVELPAFTLHASQHQHTAHVGPSEAEVRDGYGDSSITSVSSGQSGSNVSTITWMENAATFIPIIVGASASLFFIVIFSLLLVRHKLYRKRQILQNSEQSSTTSSRRHSGSAVKSGSKGTHSTLCPERDVQVETEVDLDPDLLVSALTEVPTAHGPSGPLLRPPASYAGNETSPPCFDNPGGSCTDDQEGLSPYQGHISRYPQRQFCKNQEIFSRLNLHERHLLPGRSFRGIPTVYATLNNRHSTNSSLCSLRHAHSHSNLDPACSNDLAYNKKFVPGTQHQSIQQGFASHEVHCCGHDLVQEDETSCETPLVNKRESSV